MSSEILILESCMLFYIPIAQLEAIRVLCSARGEVEVKLPENEL